MDDTVKKADLENLRKGLRQDLRKDLRKDLRHGLLATEKRLGARIEAVATDVVRHVKVDIESVKDDVRIVAERVVAIDEKLDRHIKANERAHAQLRIDSLAGDAALDKRVTSLEKRAQG
jgi:hypothetical protein